MVMEVLINLELLTLYAEVMVLIGVPQELTTGDYMLTLTLLVLLTFMATQIQLPQRRNRANSTSSISVEAGLPNITGGFRPHGGNLLSVTDLSGAFSARPNGVSVTGISGRTGTGNTGANFNASKSNSIYGNSDTVTPLSLTTKIVLKY